MEQEKYILLLKDLAWQYGPKIVMALVMLVVGLWIIQRFTALFSRFLSLRQVDPSLQSFFKSAVDVLLKLVLFLVLASTLGIETTSFIAVFSAMAFAVGLALQGSLGNFASGVLILLFRPYRTGDLVTLGGDKVGQVTEIQIFNTVLLTTQGKRLIIPNAKITDGVIENIPMDSEIRVDIKANVKDSTDLNHLRIAGQNAILRCQHRIPERGLFVEISHFVFDSLEVTVGCWTTGAHYWDTYFALHQYFKEEIDKVGVELAPSGS